MPRTLRRLGLLLLVALLATASATAQTNPLRQIVHPLDISSGVKANAGVNTELVFSHLVDLGEAPWIRLFFGTVRLEGDSYLRITSLQDNDFQILTSRTAAEWKNSTAYFNGPAVSVELFAAPGTVENSFTIREAVTEDTGPGDGTGTERVCAFNDERVAATDPAVARILPIGCTGFIIARGPTGNPNDRCLLTAGHCFPNPNGVIQFSVPLSNANCSLNNPPVAKQFPVNDATVVFNDGGTGNDYGLFRVFANVNDRTVFQEQHVNYPLATGPSSPVTINGYGTDGDPVTSDGGDINCICRNGDAQAPNNATLQTDGGNITSSSVTQINHDVHTCGGNSGSPVIDASGNIVAIHTTGGCSGSTAANAGTAITHPSVQAAIANSCEVAVPLIQVPAGPDFGGTCLGETGIRTLNVCNTGDANLVVDTITSSDPQFVVVEPSSGYVVVISPDFCFPFQVEFTPTIPGDQTATLTIPSNDPVIPSLEITATGSGTMPHIVTAVANSGNFGDVCVGAFKDKSIVVSNSGGCDLVINSIASNSPDFVVPSVVTFPIVVGPGTNVKIPIRFAPTSLGAKAGIITVFSNDHTRPGATVPVSGNVPPGDVRLTGSTDFGDVCPGVLAEKTVSVCNVGKCDLHVNSVSLNPGCLNFTLINNPFPATVSPDSCQDVVIRFTPVSVGPKGCPLIVITDDPDTPAVERLVNANTPIPSIDVPPDLGFPPTVIQSVGACNTPLPFPVSNTGTCNLTITQLGIAENPNEYSLSGLPSFPIILEPGHVVGEGNLASVFEPDNLSRAVNGRIRVTYLSDPIIGEQTNVVRQLCGEGVRTGARVLVTAGGIPLASVEQIKLTRINANRNKNLLDTVDTARNLVLQTVVPGAPCAPFQYHREYSTVSNPIQLLPGSYQVTVTAIVNGRRVKKSVGFDVNTCGFNPAITVNF